MLDLYRQSKESAESDRKTASADRRVAADDRKDNAQREKRFEQHVNDIKQSFAEHQAQIETLVMAAKIAVNPLLDAAARNTAAAAALTKVEREITESRVKYSVTELEVSDAGAAPKWLRKWSREKVEIVLNFVWPIAIRQSTHLVSRLFGLVGGGTILAALGKLIHFYVTHSLDSP